MRSSIARGIRSWPDRLRVRQCNTWLALRRTWDTLGSAWRNPGPIPCKIVCCPATYRSCSPPPLLPSSGLSTCSTAQWGARIPRQECEPSHVSQSSQDQGPCPVGRRSPSCVSRVAILVSGGMSQMVATLPIKKTGWWVYRDILARREAFTTHGALEGVPGPAVSFGRLPYEWLSSARNADYVVYSYSTPIAWHVYGGWMVPDEHYSATTSCHQGK